MQKKANIIPVASGKGGVGKSIISANLSIDIAKKGFKTILIDLDLGGSNLYSYLGLENENPGVGDYLNLKEGVLSDYAVEIQENLKFIPGECRMTFMANIPYGQKMKLLKEIKALEADFIVIDLGAGTTFNTLDYFELSIQGMLISTFEKPSIMNTLSFLKNFIFRILFKETKNNNILNQEINKLYKSSTERNPVIVKDIVMLAERHDPEIAKKAIEICNKYTPRIVFNKGESPDELKILSLIEYSVKNNISIDLSFFGFIFNDQNVKNSIKNNDIFIEKYPDSVAAKDIRQISDRIIKFSNKKIENSKSMLYEDTKEKHSLYVQL